MRTGARRGRDLKDEASTTGEPASTVPSSRSPESYDVSVSPTLRTAWLLRAVAVCGAIASAFGVLVLPGVHGIFSDRLAVWLDRTGGVLSYGMGALLVLAAVLGAFDLARADPIAPWVRAVAIAAGALVVGLFVPACATPLPGAASLVLALGAIACAGTAAAAGLRVPRTRAISAVLGAFAVATAIRLLSWSLAAVASARASTTAWDLACGVSSAAVVVEALGLMAAAAWLGTRGRWAGQLVSALALAAAFGVVWAAAHGATAGAPAWQLMLHASLANAAPGIPPPWALGTVAAFLSVVSVTLAFGVALQPGVPGFVAGTLALALLARGAFDVPLRALAVCTAATWVLVTMSDERAMRRRASPRASHAYSRPELRAP